MRLILHDNNLNVRGTSTAMYDYAINLKYKNNIECFISYDVNDVINDTRIINKFKKEFEVFGYNKFSEVDEYIKTNKIDAIYLQKSGYPDGKTSNIVPNFIHAVFPIEGKKDIHGQKFAFISEWLSDEYFKRNGEHIPFIPYMLNLPDNISSNYKSALKIDEEKIVIGRYGGIDSFDIPFVFSTIKKVLDSRDDLIFLFCNTYKFIEHPRVIFTNSLASLEEKVKFLNTCDAFLHARHRGESFGLAVLEFMSKSLPVITFGNSPEQNHIKLLNGKGYIYRNDKELFDILNNFKKIKIEYTNIKDFHPERVMEKFNKVFLK